MLRSWHGSSCSKPRARLLAWSPSGMASVTIGFTASCDTCTRAWVFMLLVGLARILVPLSPVCTQTLICVGCPFTERSTSGVFTATLGTNT
eukprot:6051532-Lingulodinium_polyedra.AAC.1